MSGREKTLSIIEMLPGLAAPTLRRDLRSLPTRRVPHLNPARGCRQRRNAGRPVLPVERSEIICLDPFGEVFAPCRELR
jgi:hypothetical protein